MPAITPAGQTPSMLKARGWGEVARDLRFGDAAFTALGGFVTARKYELWSAQLPSSPVAPVLLFERQTPRNDPGWKHDFHLTTTSW